MGRVRFKQYLSVIGLKMVSRQLISSFNLNEDIIGLLMEYVFNAEFYSKRIWSIILENGFGSPYFYVKIDNCSFLDLSRNTNLLEGCDASSLVLTPNGIPEGRYYNSCHIITENGYCKPFHLLNHHY